MILIEESEYNVLTSIAVTTIYVYTKKLISGVPDIFYLKSQ